MGQAASVAEGARTFAEGGVHVHPALFEAAFFKPLRVVASEGRERRSDPADSLFVGDSRRFFRQRSPDVPVLQAVESEGFRAHLPVAVPDA